MKRSWAIISLLIVFAIAGTVFAQGLIWSEPVQITEDSTDFYGSGYNAAIIGEDSLLIAWPDSGGKGILLRLWTPSGLSEIDTLFEDRDPPIAWQAKVLKSGREEIFIFGISDCWMYCARGHWGFWTNCDLPEPPFGIALWYNNIYLGPNGNPWVFMHWLGLGAYTVWDDDAGWSTIDTIPGLLMNPYITTFNSSDSMLVGLSYHVTGFDTYLRIYNVDGEWSSLDTVVVMPSSYTSKRFYPVGRDEWFATYLDREYISPYYIHTVEISHGLDSSYTTDTVDAYSYIYTNNTPPKIAIDYTGVVWAYWMNITDPSIRFSRVARRIGDDWILVDSLFGAGHDMKLIFDDEHNYPLYRIWGYHHLYISKCSGFTGIKETLPQPRPNSISLSAHPNPFNSAVLVAAPEGAEIEIFDINGRMIDNISVGTGLKSACGRGSEALSYEFVWQPNENIGSGVYLVRARFDKLSDRDNESVSKRIVYLK